MTINRDNVAVMVALAAIMAIIIILSIYSRDIPKSTVDTAPSVLDLESKLHDLDFSVEAEIRYLHERIESLERREALRDEAAAREREAAIKPESKGKRSCARRGCW